MRRYRVLINGFKESDFHRSIAYSLRDSGYEVVAADEELTGLAETSVQEDVEKAVFSAPAYKYREVKEMIADFESYDSTHIGLLWLSDGFFDKTFISEHLDRSFHHLDRIFNPHESVEEVVEEVMK
ncbi:MAG: hypothetical protein SVV03_03410 [Candidatus Nanohaloarchaea archaeon]|nr:hypothetical protein [Candidatus Nanohaloarchaea archaeon]